MEILGHWETQDMRMYSNAPFLAESREVDVSLSAPWSIIPNRVKKRRRDDSLIENIPLDLSLDFAPHVLDQICLGKCYFPLDSSCEGCMLKIGCFRVFSFANTCWMGPDKSANIPFSEVGVSHDDTSKSGKTEKEVTFTST